MSMRDYEYISQLPETTEAARSVQGLVLQDKILAGFDNPTAKTDPDNEDFVSDQRTRIENNPQYYSGYKSKVDDEVVAFMMANEWYTGDEAPFVPNIFARNAMILAGKLRGGSMEPKAYGVNGLVASDKLELHDMDEILEGLLLRSIGQAATHSAELINIVIHDRDPLLPIAQDNGFKPVGPVGRAAGAEEILQQRYQRPVNL